MIHYNSRTSITSRNSYQKVLGFNSNTFSEYLITKNPKIKTLSDINEQDLNFPSNEISKGNLEETDLLKANLQKNDYKINQCKIDRERFRTNYKSQWNRTSLPCIPETETLSTSIPETKSITNSIHNNSLSSISLKSPWKANIEAREIHDLNKRFSSTLRFNQCRSPITSYAGIRKKTMRSESLIRLTQLNTPLKGQKINRRKWLLKLAPIQEETA